jgi:hypothetical protein
MSLETAQKVMSRIFLNSGTLIVIGHTICCMELGISEIPVRLRRVRKLIYKYAHLEKLKMLPTGMRFELTRAEPIY